MACVPKQGKKRLYNAEINLESKIKISEGVQNRTIKSINLTLNLCKAVTISTSSSAKLPLVK